MSIERYYITFTIQILYYNHYIYFTSILVFVYKNKFKMTTPARILIKHNPSKCNKELLDFLHNNIKSIKRKFNIKVIIIYDDLISKLPASIKRLPVMILPGLAITGNSAIRQKLVTALGTTQIKTNAPVKDMGICDLQDYWNTEMHSKADNDHPDDTIMEHAKNKAVEISTKRQESTARKKKRIVPEISNNREDNIQLEQIQGEKISDLVDSDPMMQKFWDNQETTPGFGGEGGGEVDMDF